MKRNKYGRRLQPIEISDIDDMDGLFFKDYVIKLLREKGFTNIKVTKRSRDFGVGLVASKSKQRYAIQVERRSGKVSTKAVSGAIAGKKWDLCHAMMAIRIVIYRERQMTVQPPMNLRPLIEVNR